MTDQDIRQQAIALYDRFTHEGRDRRAFLTDLTRLAGSTAAANALLLSIAANPAAAAIIAEDDKRVGAREIAWQTKPGGQMKGYLARPRGAQKPLAGIVVVHENRGLQPYTRDVARRAAIAGFVALAPDFLSPLGGTPASEDDARARIGELDLAATVGDALGAIAWLKAERRTTGKIGIVGFCWGGALVNRVAVAAGTALGAGVAFYGPAPAPAEAAGVGAPLLLHYAGLDDRVNQSGAPWVAALKAAGKSVSAFTYPGVNHAFHNDTSAERYDAAAAKLAWDRTIAFFREKLA